VSVTLADELLAVAVAVGDAKSYSSKSRREASVSWMEPRMKAVILGLALSFGAPACFADSPFDGKWTGVFNRPAPAGDQTVTISVTTDEMGRVSGVMTLAGVVGEVPIDWGYVKDDLIVYKVTTTGPGGVLPFVYIGKLNNGAIEFGRRPEDLKVGLLVRGSAHR